MLFQVIPLQVTTYTTPTNRTTSTRPNRHQNRDDKDKDKDNEEEEEEEEEKDRARDATRLEPLVRFFYSLFSVLIITFLSRLRSTPALELPSLLPLPPSSPSPAASSPSPSSSSPAAASTSPGPDTQRVSGLFSFFFFAYFLLRDASALLRRVSGIFFFTFFRLYHHKGSRHMS